MGVLVVCVCVCVCVLCVDEPGATSRHGPQPPPTLSLQIWPGKGKKISPLVQSLEEKLWGFIFI